MNKKLMALAAGTMLTASGSALAIDVCDGDWKLVCRSSTGNTFTNIQPGHVEAEREGSFQAYLRCIRANPDNPEVCDDLMPRLVGKSLHWGAHNFWKKDSSGRYVTTADGGTAITWWSYNVNSCSGSTHTLWSTNPDPQWRDYTCTVTKQ
ncbi:hypothetical protein [Pleionea sp. CnH1-48]|uniref:hypothetical protein n=1 Tax=Pleionea sp. CnH1-48 TaxID=2954494 RepID=UPI002096E920|nr:hypothetical protein [Pleionea sp. CnH1-48]MCO7224789.1 hypothetical protein [Pleionea sp. CnH1-48]